MNGHERRRKIIEMIEASGTPLSGKALADFFEVSRQVIVQDVALIRANGVDIISTNRGYVIHTSKVASRVFLVNHTDEQLEAELCMIVDMGGKVVNVTVEHKIYGKIEAELNISSRRHVQDFVADLKSGKSSPLKNITSNDHAHLVEAESEAVLNIIEAKLEEMGILA